MNSLYVNKHAELTSESSEERIGELIDLARSGKLSKDVLVELLFERHAVYKDRSNYQTTRIKGYAMASFEAIGLPNSALNFVLDELQNGKNAYVVAAAARALRGIRRPGSQYVDFLLQALNNIRYHDDSVSLETFKPSWPLKNPSTAKKEILRTLQWLRGYAKGALPHLTACIENPYDFDPDTKEEIQRAIDTIETDNRKLDLACCQIEGKEVNGFSWLRGAPRNIKTIGGLEVENEESVRRSLKDIVDEKPTVVCFFYTRCMNPNKCTLTINKLGWLQEKLVRYGLQEKVNLLAFTYDPSYDSPTKMHVFGKNRGLIFSSNVHMLRTSPEDFSILSDFFNLGINHVNSTVNQHRLELFLLDQRGNIKTSYTRLQWEVENVFRDIKGLLKRSTHSGWLSSLLSSSQQVCFPVLLAFFPKCPICWVVYLSAFGVSGLQTIPYSPWLIPWIIFAIVLNLVILYRKARVRNGLTPFWLSLAGGLLVIVPGYLFSSRLGSMLGIALLLIGALSNSLPHRQWSKWIYLVSSVLKGLKSISLKELLTAKEKNVI